MYANCMIKNKTKDISTKWTAQNFVKFSSTNIHFFFASKIHFQSRPKFAVKKCARVWSSDFEGATKLASMHKISTGGRHIEKERKQFLWLNWTSEFQTIILVGENWRNNVTKSEDCEDSGLQKLKTTSQKKIIVNSNLNLNRLPANGKGVETSGISADSGLGAPLEEFCERQNHQKNRLKQAFYQWFTEFFFQIVRLNLNAMKQFIFGNTQLFLGMLRNPNS